VWTGYSDARAGLRVGDARRVPRNDEWRAEARVCRVAAQLDESKVFGDFYDAVLVDLERLRYSGVDAGHITQQGRGRSTRATKQARHFAKKSAAGRSRSEVPYSGAS
jgi:hypothetical protein